MPNNYHVLLLSLTILSGLIKAAVFMPYGEYAFIELGGLGSTLTCMSKRNVLLRILYVLDLLIVLDGMLDASQR